MRRLSFLIFFSLFLAFNLSAGVFTSDLLATVATPNEVRLKTGKTPDGFLMTGLELTNGWAYLSFWFKPNFSSDDNQRHVIAVIENHGKPLFLVEKSAKNLLRFVSLSGEKKAAARASVNFKPGEWHHIAVACFVNEEKVPAGIALFFDRENVSGEIPSKDSFFSEPKEELVDIRFLTAQGEFANPVARNERWGGKRWFNVAYVVRLVYDDFFRALPAEEIRITPYAWRINVDTRIVKGIEKTFGLEAKLNGEFMMVTDEITGYGNWSEFDAKPYIKWSVDNTNVAEVVKKEKAAKIKGLALGKVTITAEYRHLKASFETEVIPEDLPDLCIQFVEMLPRYSYKREKVRIAPGDAVTSIVHVANYGTKPTTPDEKLLFCMADKAVEFKVPSLQSLQTITFTNVWVFPVEPILISARVEPSEDLCLANNEIKYRSDARPLWFAIEPNVMSNYFTAGRFTCLGSRSLFDWISAHKYRLDLLLKETKYPDICPDGLLETYRIDKIVYNYYQKDKDNEYFKNEEYRDGGFPITENPKDHGSHQHSDKFFETIYASIIHELGHTCLALPDVYCYPVRARNVLLRNPKGELYVGTSRLPRFGEDIMRSSAENVPCGTEYEPLMTSCHMWINKANAGKIAYCAGYRGPRFWGVQGRFIPISENILKIYDVDDNPLKDAAVYIYHVSHAKINAFADKYFADCPKFKGYTDQDGCYHIPQSTDKQWDGGLTDRFDGETDVWNPFGMPTDEQSATRDTAATPSVWRVEGLLLIKIVSGSDVFFQLLPMTEFNEQFFAGDKFRGVYEIRTQLKQGKKPELEKRQIAKAVSKVNKAPVALLETNYFKVKAGKKIRLDASQHSYDPEGQPLIYHWHDAGNWYATDSREGPIQEYVAPQKPGDKIKKAFYVLDGIRGSKLFEFTIEAK